MNNNDKLDLIFDYLKQQNQKFESKFDSMDRNLTLIYKKLEEYDKETR